MASWFTPRRLLVYGAYFWGAFSLILGLFISKHVWSIHKTVRLIEKSWEARGHNYSDWSWSDKAFHAVFAGHEDTSDYDKLFWTKYRELNGTEHGEGSFDRSNLTTCKPGYEPEWVNANAGYEKWGFVLYRADYQDDDETWAANLRHINHTIRAHLEIEATQDGAECDPDHVRDRAVLEVIEDRETLHNATIDTVRELWRKRVDDGLVDASFKTGGWNFGWFRINLNRGDGERTTWAKAGAMPNGLGLNVCLMYDSNTQLIFTLYNSGLPATGPRDPWEPFLVAVDGMYSHERYMYLTSWAHEYSGSYGVALSILFNDFHGRVFQREMERQAPRLFMGGPMVDDSAPWWLRICQVLLGMTHAVARPGVFPFHDRWQEMAYPFVREDSHWGLVDDSSKGHSAEHSHTTAEVGDDLAQFLLSEPAPPKIYLPCFQEDEDQEGCFQVGNLRMKEAKSPEPATSSDTV